MHHTFSVLKESYGIYQLAEDATVPTPTRTGFWSFTRAQNETTIVCSVGDCPHANAKNEGWKAIKLHGPFDFALTGIVAEVGQVLATANIGVFVISTFDTDYVLVKEHNVDAAVTALVQAGHLFKNT